MRYTRKHIEGALNALNRAARLANMPERFQIEHANGGWKLTTHNGSRNVWNERLPAREFYGQVWAYTAGIEAANEARQPNEYGLSLADLYLMIDTAERRRQHIANVAQESGLDYKTSKEYNRLGELLTKLQILRDREP